jgi:MFS family permease
MVGSLLADPIVRRLGRRWTLVASSVVSVGTAIAAGLLDAPVAVAGMIVVYAASVSLFWPPVSSLVSVTGPPAGMSRRLGVYNLVWSGTSAVSIALTGLLIEHLPIGLFVIPAAMHVANLAIVLTQVRDPNERDLPATTASLEPEPELLRLRTLALWLSRIALPGTLILIGSLWAMFPVLPSVRDLEPSIKTLVTSVFVMMRFVMFGVLAFTVAWHSRPRLLLGASIATLVAYLGITIRPTDLFGDAANVPMWVDLVSLILWQIVAGACLGLVYAASLYFGMVLSKGSTEHGGYHESLIGLGGVIGPGVAAAVQWQFPDDLRASITSVAVLLTMTVLVAVIVTIVQGRKTPTQLARSVS